MKGHIALQELQTESNKRNILRKIENFNLNYHLLDAPGRKKHERLFNIIKEDLSKISLTDFFNEIYHRLTFIGRTNFAWIYETNGVLKINKGRLYITGDKLNISVLNTELIIKTVSAVHGLPFQVFRKKTRRHEKVFARFALMWAMKQYSTYSLNEIGELFEGDIDNQGKDHSSVINGLNTYDNLITTNSRLKIQHQLLVSELDKYFETNKPHRAEERA